MSKCKACGAEIIWIKTKDGKSMPCDAEKHFYNILKGKTIFITADGNVLKGESFYMGMNSDGKNIVMGYTPHWGTCSNADSFRKRRGG